MKDIMKEKKEQLIYFSSGNPTETIDAWIGTGSYIHKFEINVFGWHIVFWRKA